MFFVSEEFLREYRGADEVTQTIDEAVADGEDLFGGDYRSKSDTNVGRRDSGGADTDPG